MSQPRQEHPRPQFQRSAWLNLNGQWKYAFDFGLSGEQREWHRGFPTTGEITVPYCPESRLSGVGYTDFIPAIWYQRQFTVPSAWAGKRVLLHFGAVDYDCRAWINGQLVGRHYGGSSSFTFDITACLRSDRNEVVVCARDDVRSGLQPRGKQSPEFHSHGCLYTRTTGIWQTVWLEAVPASHLAHVQIAPDLDSGSLAVTPTFTRVSRAHMFRVTVLDAGAQVASVTASAASGRALIAELPQPRAWTPVDPHLYDLRLELLADGQVVDQVLSYAGLRKFHIEGNCFFLNNAPVFLRLVLDQGFYPDGIWTAPDDAALKGDIQRSLAVGFNGARLHQKVFEERFHYWADRLGYLTWGEYADWGMDFADARAVRNQQREWREIVLRDRNHPSIIAWTPFNETAGQVRGNPENHRQVVQETVDLTRALDPARPINDTSGYVHVCADIFTVHDYDQNPETFRKRYANLAPDHPESAFVCFPDDSVAYAGQPYVVDEYGGTWWAGEGHSAGNERDPGWGYGNRPQNIDEVYRRIEQLSAVLTEHPHIAGFTYTQLTDVEQEQNGIYTYDRQPKFAAARLRRAFGGPAAIEKPAP